MAMANTSNLMFHAYAINTAAPVRRRVAPAGPMATRLHRHRWSAAGIGSLALLGMVAAFALVPTGSEALLHRPTVREQLAPPSVKSLGNASSTYHREERILHSDSLPNLFSRLGLSDPEALDFIRTSREAQVISRQLRPGKAVSAKTGEHGELVALYFPLDGKDATLVVERSDNGFMAHQQVLVLDKQIEVKSGEIRHSLFGATDRAGIPETIATQLAEIFSGDINFHRDLRKGDSFSLVYETFTHQGQPIRSGRILSAEFTNNQRVFNAFWFQAEEGKGGYYSADGKALRKAFLRSPLEFSRVTSGFSHSRFHPVLQISRAHKGVDYGAPIGTRVRAVADGSVDFSGVQGGYGKLIVLKHQGAFSTAYGHLNGFAAGIKKGTRVKQGDTIGFVGRTGLASGPHLHYEFRVNARQVNPLAVSLPAAATLEPWQISRFKASIGLFSEHLKQASAARRA
jgi:murein DD-endopeptidase MepM/ murein hydrolase activator NlpD